MTSTSTPDTRPNLRPLLLRAVAVDNALIGAVTPADLDRPTPCTDFTVRDLLDHLVLVIRRIRVVLAGGDYTTVPLESGLPDDELAAAWADGSDELRRSLPDVDLDAPVTAPFGTLPAGAALGAYLTELTVHAWDLAAALGRADLLDGSWAAPLLPMFQERLPREGREHTPFAEVVDVAVDASAYDRLVAWTGRDPRWTAA